MAQKGRSIAGMGYTGYPALIYFGLLNYGFGGRSHYENMTLLKKTWSFCETYIDAIKEEKEKEFFPLNLDEKISDCFTEIKLTHELYRPDFESLGTCSPEEKQFISACDDVFYRLNRIIAPTKIIDNVEIKLQEGFDFVNPHANQTRV